MWKKLREKLSGIQPAGVLRSVDLNTIFIKENVLCECSNGQVSPLGFFETLPLEDGHWTSCSVEKCVDCGKIRGFPEDNIKEAILHGTLETKEALRRVGVPVEEYISEVLAKKAKEKLNDEINPSRRDEE